MINSSRKILVSINLKTRFQQKFKRIQTIKNLKNPKVMLTIILTRTPKMNIQMSNQDNRVQTALNPNLLQQRKQQDRKKCWIQKKIKSRIQKKPNKIMFLIIKIDHSITKLPYVNDMKKWENVPMWAAHMLTVSKNQSLIEINSHQILKKIIQISFSQRRFPNLQLIIQKNQKNTLKLGQIPNFKIKAQNLQNHHQNQKS